jgi:putative transcriptional regulator
MTYRLTHNRRIVATCLRVRAARRICFCLLGMCALVMGQPLLAQSPDNSAGLGAAILIAAPEVQDSNFKHSVVLVTNTPVGEVIGLVLNRPTDQPWPHGLRPPEKSAGQHMHFGGPLIPQATLAVGAADMAVAETLDLGAGLRLAIGLKNTLALANAGGPDGVLKLFNGYAGWGPGQLEAEVAAGVWQVRPVSAELVFDPAPATQWERLTAMARAVRAAPTGQARKLFNASSTASGCSAIRAWPLDFTSTVRCPEMPACSPRALFGWAIMSLSPSTSRAGHFTCAARASPPA